MDVYTVFFASLQREMLSVEMWTKKKLKMGFRSQVDQIWLADDRKPTNIEVLGVVSIETDLV